MKKSKMMKCTFVMLLISAATLQLIGQDLNLPAKSPAAAVSFTVGYTEIEITYSSPAVHERKIWGGLVPYDEVWRAGANKATSMSFSTEINIEGTVIEPGSYAFFLIPKKGDKWTAVFNRVADQWGAYQYDESEDVARVEVPVKFVKVNQERLNYEVIDQTADQGYIKLAWADARVYIRFLVNVVDEAMEQVDLALEAARPDQQWLIYAKGADFLLQTGKQIDQAMEWAEASTELKDVAFNWWVKARVLAEKDMMREAISAGRTAIEWGEKDSSDLFYKSNAGQIKALMDHWANTVNQGR